MSVVAVVMAVADRAPVLPASFWPPAPVLWKPCADNEAISSPTACFMLSAWALSSRPALAHSSALAACPASPCPSANSGADLDDALRLLVRRVGHLRRQFIHLPRLPRSHFNAAATFQLNQPPAPFLPIAPQSSPSSFAACALRCAQIFALHPPPPQNPWPASPVQRHALSRNRPRSNARFLKLSHQSS